LFAGQPFFRGSAVDVFFPRTGRQYHGLRRPAVPIVNLGVPVSC